MGGPGSIPKNWSGFVPAQRPAQPSPGAFNLDAPDVRVIRIPLDAANVRRELNITGNCIWAVRASSPSAVMTLHFNQHEADGVPVNQGLAFRTPPFQRIYLENSAQAGQWIDLVYFVSQFDFFVVNPGSIVSTVSVAKPTTGANAQFSIAAATTTAVLAADATRQAAIIKNEGTVPVRVAFNTATAISDTVGILLQPGESITLEGTLGINVRNLTGAGANATINLITIND